MRKIVIIGNGIAGITCARHIRKKVNDHITIISGETDHFFSRTALMYIYMGHMKYEHTKPYEDFFWSKNKLELIKDFVVAIDTKQKQLHTKDNRNISYDILIIASGSITKKYDWPGQDLKGVISLYSYPDLEEMERQTFGIKNAVIVGGGLIGVEMAEMLHSRGIQVTMLVKEKYYWSSALPQTDAKLIGDHITSHGIKMLYNTELKEIDGDGSGKVSSITTSAGKKIDCPVIGITTGVKPNISFLKNSGIEIDKGVLVNKYFETNIENVYAIGDCAQFKESINGRKEIEQIWYTGRMHAETLAQTICNNKTAYNPGPWFNSAKFFDVEFQTYGIVLPKLDIDQNYFHWQHPEKEIALTVVFNTSSKLLIGINAFGMRLRHEYFDKWLREKVTIDYMLENLQQALFDKEFSKNYIPDIITAYNRETGATIFYKIQKRFAFFNF